MSLEEFSNQIVYKVMGIPLESSINSIAASSRFPGSWIVPPGKIFDPGRVYLQGSRLICADASRFC